MAEHCPFCPENPELQNHIVARNEHCFLVRSIDPVLKASMMATPVRHVATPFDLTPEEWIATRDLLHEAKRRLDVEQPDGYSIGWNVHEVGGQTVPHVHLHVIGRFADEPLAGQGIRYALKQPSNMRRVVPEAGES